MVYKQLGLPLRIKIKKRLPARVKEPIVIPGVFIHTWSNDFMSDSLAGGRKLRSINVIEDYSREVMFIETDYSLKSSREIWGLKHLINRHGNPKKIRLDNVSDKYHPVTAPVHHSVLFCGGCPRATARLFN